MEDIAKKSQNKNSSGKWMAAHQVPTKAISENGNSSDADKKSKAQQLQRTLGTITQKYKGGTEGAKNDVEELTSMDREYFVPKCPFRVSRVAAATSNKWMVPPDI